LCLGLKTLVRVGSVFLRIETSIIKKPTEKNPGIFVNKRAYRALGRSPEENVKGQGEAIYRGPLMLSTKYW